MAKKLRIRKNLLEKLGLTILIVLGFLFFNQLTVSDEVKQIIITSENQIIQTDSGAYSVFQKYQVGKDSYCVNDCESYTRVMDKEFFIAYSRKFGECMCKYKG